MEALWEAIKALQEPEKGLIALPIDGYCGGNRQGLRGRYLRLIDEGVRPGLVQDKKEGLLQRLRKPYSDLTVVYMVRKRREGSIGRYDGRGLRFRR
jgi:hypothetical protein